jgi:hypothetical protein
MEYNETENETETIEKDTIEYYNNGYTMDDDEIDYYVGYSKESVSFGANAIKPLRVYGYPWELCSVEHPWDLHGDDQIYGTIEIKLSEDLEKQNWKLLGVSYSRFDCITVIIHNDNPIMKAIMGYENTCSFIVQNMSKEDMAIKEKERVRTIERLDYEMDRLSSDNNNRL